MFLSEFSISTSSASVFFAVLFAATWWPTLWDRALRYLWPEKMDRTRQLRIDKAWMRNLLRIWSVLIIAGALALGPICSAWPLACTWTVLMGMLPGIVMDSLIYRQEMRLESQIAIAAGQLSNAVRAGQNVNMGIAEIYPSLPAPLAGILSQVIFEVEHGRPLVEALRERRYQIPLEALTLFCLVLEICLERGGRINLPLEKLAASLRDWERLRQKLHAETASGRLTVLLLSLTPFAFLLVSALDNPSSLWIYVTQFNGQCLLSVIVLLVWMANRWSDRILRLRLT